MRIDPMDAAGLPLRLRRPRAGRWTQLVSALMRLADGKAEMLHHAETPWTSVTFSGTRHAVMLRFDGHEGVSAAERFIAELPEHEFALSGQIVADASVISVDHALLPAPRIVLEIELLLLDDS